MLDEVPTYEVDLFSDSAILDPYPHYKAMRDLGPVVFLSAHGIYAISRYSDAKKALLAHDKFLSGRGIAGFDWPEEMNGVNTIGSDEPVHSRYREVVGTPLRPPELSVFREQIETASNDLIDRLIRQGSFDGMVDFARYLPVAIVSSLVGLPEEGREKMLDWAAAAFDACGVGNARAQAAFPELGSMLHYIQTQCGPSAVTPGSWAAQIWDAVDRGKIAAHEAGMLVADIVAPALDTTIFATGHLLYRLGTNQDQWERLKADGSLLSSAVDEIIRLESPIRTFARVTAEERNVDGAILPSGARVLILFASANRDERKWESPDRYWIERPGLTGHLGFGVGHHVCAGQHLAKLELRSLLKAILAKVHRIEVGTPVREINNILHGFRSLPARFEAVA